MLRPDLKPAEMFPGEASRVPLQRASPEVYIDIVIDAIALGVIARMVEDYLEGIEEYGMPPERSFAEVLGIADEWGRSRWIIEMTHITEHNNRALRMGDWREFIPLDATPLPRAQFDLLDTDEL